MNNKVLCTQGVNCGRTKWKPLEMDCEGCGLERYPDMGDRARMWVDQNTSMRRCVADLPQSVLDARNYRLIYLESRLCAFAEAEVRIAQHEIAVELATRHAESYCELLERGKGDCAICDYIETLKRNNHTT